MSIEHEISDLLGARKKDGFLFRLLLVLGCIVVAATTYALVLPAITMEGDYICGKEVHIHSEDCYAVTESGEQVLICGMEEHLHDEHCLAPKQMSGSEYICGYDYEHVHGDECYINGELICTLTAHRHSDSCLPEEEEEPVVQTMSAPEEPEAEAAAQETSEAEESEPEQMPQQEVSTEQEQTGETEEQPTEESQTQEQTENANGQEGETSETVEETEGENGTAPDGETDAAVTEEVENPAEETDAAEAEEGENTTSEEEAATPEEGVTAEGESAEGDTETVELPAPASLTDAAEEIDVNALATATNMTEEELEQVLYAERMEAYAGLNMSSVPSVVSAALGENDKLNDLEAWVGADKVKFQVLDKDGNEIPPALASVSSSNLTYVLTVDAEKNKLSDYTLVDWEGRQFCDVYYYAINEPDLVLLAYGSFLEDYAADWVYIDPTESRPAQMKVLRVDGQGYIFLFRSMGGDTSYISLTSTRKETPLQGIEKNSEFVPEEMAYRYIVETVIPHAANQYDASYYLEDSTSIGTQRYGGFQKNEDNLVVTIDGTRIYPIEDVYEDSGATVAYYLDEGGKLWLLNRSDHSRHMAEQGAASYPGWCYCWQNLEDVTLKVVYLDTYAKNLYNAVDTNYIYNNASISDTRGFNVSARSVTNSNISQILKKEYIKQDMEFVITVNEPMLDMGEIPLEIEDTMDNAQLDGGITLIRKDNASDPGTVQTEGTDYTLSVAQNGTSFTLEIKRPSDDMFQIRYKIKGLEGRTSDLATNIVAIHDANITRSVGFNVDVNESEMSTRGASFRVSLEKIYENDNPDTGATFGIFDAETGDQLGKSYTRGASGDSAVHNTRAIFSNVRNTDMAREPYTPSGSVDVIWFESSTLSLQEDVVYLIQETEAPPEYVQNQEEIYFYATHKEEVPAQAAALIAEGKTVYRLDNWVIRTNSKGVAEDYEDFAVPSRLYNACVPYDLPSTGGHWLYTVQLCGFVSMLIGAAGLLYRKEQVRRK